MTLSTSGEQRGGGSSGTEQQLGQCKTSSKGICFAVSAPQFVRREKRALSNHRRRCCYRCGCCYRCCWRLVALARCAASLIFSSVSPSAARQFTTGPPPWPSGVGCHPAPCRLSPSSRNVPLKSTTMCSSGSPTTACTLSFTSPPVDCCCFHQQTTSSSLLNAAAAAAALSPVSVKAQACRLARRIK